jgi:hypothetical protein
MEVKFIIPDSTKQFDFKQWNKISYSFHSVDQITSTEIPELCKGTRKLLQLLSHNTLHPLPKAFENRFLTYVVMCSLSTATGITIWHNYCFPHHVNRRNIYIVTFIILSSRYLRGLETSAAKYMRMRSSGLLHSEVVIPYRRFGTDYPETSLRNYNYSLPSVIAQQYSSSTFVFLCFRSRSKI